LSTALEAAIAGGFTGCSLWASTVVSALADGARRSDLRRTVLDSGVAVDHVEAVIGWVGADDPGAPYAEEASWAQVFDAALVLGAPAVTALLFGKRDAGEDAAADAFARIAAEASEHGLDVALEFAPGTPVPDLATAVRVTKAVDRGGVVFDTWHAHYGSTTAADVAALDGGRVTIIQVSDGPADRPTGYGDATRHHRMLPGSGACDPTATVAALRAAGCRAPLTVEVFNDELAVVLGAERYAVALGASLRSMEGGP
jgi:sugar phosphate isomerase/epimerase